VLPDEKRSKLIDKDLSQDRRNFHSVVQMAMYGMPYLPQCPTADGMTGPSGSGVSTFMKQLRHCYMDKGFLRLKCNAMLRSAVSQP